MPSSEQTRLYPSADSDRHHAEPSTEQPNDLKPAYRHRPPKHNGFMIWWKELIAALLAVGMCFATVGTLYPYQGRPLPQWPYSITVNALLSAYMVVLKATVVYLLAESIGYQKWAWFSNTAAQPLYDFVLHDEATRGPIGAIGLLWKTSVRHIWQWLSCILLLVALFVDPFTQQVLQYSDCNVLDHTGSANIPRSNFFAGSGTHVAAGTLSITADEQTAINAGIVAPGSVIDMTCSSGNCTFSPYGTIGFCSSCVDISDHVGIKMENFTFNNQSDYPSTITGVPGGLTVQFVEGFGQSNFSTFGMLDDGTLQFVAGLPILPNTDPIMIGPLDPATGEQPSGCNDAATNNTWRCEGYGAANCTIYPCVRTYNATMNNGALKETLLAQTPNSDITFGMPRSSTSMTTINATCLTPKQRGFLAAQGYPINASTEFVPYNLSGQPSTLDAIPKWVSNDTELNDFEKAAQKQGCMYIIEHGFVQGLLPYLNRVSSGNLTGDWDTYGGAMAMFEGPQMLQTLYNFGDYGFNRTESLFQNISESLTKHMRTHSGINASANPFNLDAPAIGLVWQDKTCLTVRWPWLALSWALVALTLVVFVQVMLTQGYVAEDVRTWKSSTLPLMYYAHQDPNGRGPSDPVDYASQDVSRLEGLAKRTLATEMGADAKTTGSAQSKRLTTGDDGNTEMGADVNLNTFFGRQVSRRPNSVFLRFIGEPDLTYADVDTLVKRLTGGLQGAGVMEGSRVLVMMRNCSFLAYSWLAIGRLGGIWVPANEGLRSKALRNVLETTDPALILVDDNLAEYLHESGASITAPIYIRGTGQLAGVGHNYPEVSELMRPSESSLPAVQTSPDSAVAFTFTSGSTGRSKACVLSHESFINMASTLIRHCRITSEDVLFCPFPLHHVDASSLTIAPALLTGAVAAFSTRFSAETFWDEIRSTGATVYDFMGNTLTLTMNNSPSSLDRTHNVRLAWGIPLTDAMAQQYEARFGHPVVTLYGSSEAGLPIFQEGDLAPGSCGKIQPGVRARIVDDSGNPLLHGTPGQLLLRPLKPATFFSGYFGDDAKTKGVFEDGWFHTGDLGKLDKDGNFYFIGRLKDIVRRRGELVSTEEVEALLSSIRLLIS
ncbi:hypothetical protein PRZ48_009088 [Zasmidium cellare]|uniref:AMP-dependent synthetase/ligase domain-containing protein n=1 Tax=Zasmidium cellare TaxID=395010 RepID=A0ABR0EHA3_ZASCE|nr:hypothetical protein PRZ48_009088 [Zasmidium cellare]